MRAFPIRAGIAAVLLAACPAAAQTTDATLVAEVLTGGGAPLAGATVTVRNASTGFIARGRTSADGRVSFRQLPLGGPYSVGAERIGWAPQLRTGYQLGLGSRIEVSLLLPERSVELPRVESHAEVHDDAEYWR